MGQKIFMILRHGFAELVKHQIPTESVAYVLLKVCMIVFYFWVVCVSRFWQIINSIFKISVAISLKTLDL